MGKLVIFSAPSGSGKSTIVNYLLDQKLNLQFSVSATSRLPRGTEVHGKDYHFLSLDEFQKKIEAGDFLEYEEVYEGKFYGTLKTEVQSMLDRGVNVIFDVDVVGGYHIKQYFGDRALAVFIQVPSIDTLRERLLARATDTIEVVNARVSKAQYEMTFAPKFDTIIVNDNLEKAKAEALSIVSQFIKK